MKREIKFRIWTGNMMEYNITAGKFGTFYVNPEKGDGLNPSDTASLTTCTTKYHEDVPVMQFTGLKDKNGKEIWEGDICQAAQGEQTKADTFYKVLSRVVFWRGGFEFFQKSLRDVNCDENGYAQNIKWCWHGHFNTPDIYEEINSIEVIGNIYETPDLA